MLKQAVRIKNLIRDKYYWSMLKVDNDVRLCWRLRSYFIRMILSFVATKGTYLHLCV